MNFRTIREVMIGRNHFPGMTERVSYTALISAVIRTEQMFWQTISFVGTNSAHLGPA